MKRIIAVLLMAALIAAPVHAENYGTTPPINLPENGEGNWGTKLRAVLQGMDDFTAKYANPDGTLKASTTATPWQAVTSSVTYVSTSSFSVSSTLAAYFEVGRKVWVVQATQVIGSVSSISTVGGTTTVTLANIVLYSDNFTPSSVGNPITSVSVSMATPRSAPADTYRRNVIINGRMAVDQRNGGAAQTITADGVLHYSVDRWYASVTGANVTGQRVTGSGSSQYRYQFTGAASVTGIGFGTRLESKDAYFLNGSTATLSVDLSNSLLTSVTWTAYYANSADAFGTIASPTRTQIATGTFTVSSTLARYNTQIAIPSAATTGIEIVFSVGAQTSGTWTIGDVQLEQGFIPTPFEYEAYPETLRKCYRFYTVGNKISLTDRAITATATWGTARTFPVPMRVAPTVVISAQGGTTGQARYNGTVANATVSGITTDGFDYSFNSTASGLVAQNAVSTDCSYTASAEL